VHWHDKLPSGYPAGQCALNTAEADDPLDGMQHKWP
jgi:hypothetical protein